VLSTQSVRQAIQAALCPRLYTENVTFYNFR